MKSFMKALKFHRNFLILTSCLFASPGIAGVLNCEVSTKVPEASGRGEIIRAFTLPKEAEKNEEGLFLSQGRSYGYSVKVTNDTVIFTVTDVTHSATALGYDLYKRSNGREIVTLPVAGGVGLISRTANRSKLIQLSCLER